MTEQERLEQGLLKGSMLSVYSKLVKAYARKCGVTPFSGFIDGNITVTQQSASEMTATDEVVYHKSSGVFYLKRTTSSGGGLGQSGSITYFSNWATRSKYVDSEGITLTDRFFASIHGYIVNDKYIDFGNFDEALAQLRSDLAAAEKELNERIDETNSNIGDALATAMSAVGTLRTEVNNNITSINNRINELNNLGLKWEIVDTLPQKEMYLQVYGTSIPENIIFMVPVRDKKGDYYNEYKWVEAKETYEQIGTSQTSLEGFTTTSEQNRLVASTIGLELKNTPTPIELKSGDKVRIISLSGGDVDVTEASAQITDIVPEGFMQTFTKIEMDEEVVLTKDGKFVNAIPTNCPPETRFFITSNSVNNVGIPHLTDADVTKIFNEATEG